MGVFPAPAGVKQDLIALLDSSFVIANDWNGLNTSFFTNEPASHSLENYSKTAKQHHHNVWRCTGKGCIRQFHSSRYAYSPGRRTLRTNATGPGVVALCL